METSSAVVKSELISDSLGGLESRCSKVTTLLAGAIAGFVSEIILHPFDTLSHRSKVNSSPEYSSFIKAYKTLMKNEGPRSLLAGLSVTFFQAPASTAVYYLTYETMKSVFLKTFGTENSNLTYLLAGASTEIVNTMFFIPLEVVKARLQLGSNPSRATGGMIAQTTNYSGIFSALKGIYQAQGIRGVTAGWNTNLFQDMVFSAVQFMTYERCKQFFETHNGGRDPTPHQLLVCGSTAGAIAAMATNPLDIITSRVMILQSSGTKIVGSPFLHVVRGILSVGPHIFLRGLFPRLLQIAPMSAMSFTVYEYSKRHLGSIIDGVDPDKEYEVIPISSNSKGSADLSKNESKLE